MIIQYQPVVKENGNVFDIIENAERSGEFLLLFNVEYIYINVVELLYIISFKGR